MAETFKSTDAVRFADFLSAISGTTARMSETSVRFAALADASASATRTVARLSSSPARMVAQSQEMATCCQCPCASPSKEPTAASTYVDSGRRAFFLGALTIAAVKLWAEASKWLWTVAFAPLVTRAGIVLGRLLIPTWQALAASEVLATIAETTEGALTTVAGRSVSPAMVAIAGIGLITGALYVFWRNWTTIVRTLRSVTNVIYREVIALMREVAAAITGDSEDTTDEALGLTGQLAGRRKKWVTSAAQFASLPSIQSSVGPRFLLSDGALRGAALAMLAAPLLAAPTLAAVPARRAGIDGTGVASIVINSSPTITVNGCELDDIQPRILEALKQHREAIFQQWCSEVQRRQRTEF